MLFIYFGDPLIGQVLDQTRRLGFRFPVYVALFISTSKQEGLVFASLFTYFLKHTPA